jgi:hypothetical protein
MAAVTAAELRAALEITFVVAELIRSKGEIPSGELYSLLMDKVSFEGYQGLLRTLTNAKLIKVSNHLITWVGPEFDADGRKV